MSIFAKFQARQHLLFVTGDDGDNQVIIGRDPDGHLLVNSGAISPSGATISNVDVIRVNGGGGNDVISLDETNGPLPSAQLLGGGGNDTLSGGSGSDELSGQGGDDILSGRGGADLLSGGGGNDFIAGGAGEDVLFGGGGDDFIDGDQGVDIAYLGAGNDVFRWDPGDGSDVVEGGSGFDEMLFNGAGGIENFTLSADGSRALFSRVQGSITMDLNDVEQVTVNALGGADTITINDLSGTDVTDVDINLGTDNAADIVSINGDDAFTVTVGQNGALTILGGSGAVVHITGFETGMDQLVLNGDLFVI